MYNSLILNGTCHVISHQNYIYLLYLDCHVKRVDVIVAGKIITTSTQALRTTTIIPTIIVVVVIAASFIIVATALSSSIFACISTLTRVPIIGSEDDFVIPLWRGEHEWLRALSLAF